MVAQNVDPQSKTAKVAQGKHRERPTDPIQPVRGTPSDPGPGGPANPGEEGPDGRPAPVNPVDEESRRAEAERVQRRREQANGDARGESEQPVDLTRGNIDRAVQYIMSALNRSREAWDADDSRAFDAALRDLDNALTEMGRKA